MNKVLYDLRNSEADSLARYMIRAYKAAASGGSIVVAADTYLASLFGELESRTADLTLAINRDPVVNAMGSADKGRDLILRSLKKLLQGYAIFPSAAKREAGKRLLAVYGKYGSALTRESYASESALIKSMLEDYADAQLSPTLAILPDVAEVIGALRASEEAFEGASDRYTDAVVARGKSASDLKRPLVAVINERLVPYLNAVSAASGYETFSRYVEAAIRKTNEAVVRRRKA